MSLARYNRKRHFSSTPEPAGKKIITQESLRFVVQKHNASHLHYDFRLELQGVLKSWAVPKGPSMNPRDRRLAIMVEDHPLSYEDFEGVIPEGNYGAGEVIVWDHGYYVPVGEEHSTKAEMEKIMRQQVDQGEVKIILYGKKLQGEFVLVQTHNEIEHGWLLIKIKDQYAGQHDITKEDRSVISGRTLKKR